MARSIRKPAPPLNDTTPIADAWHDRWAVDVEEDSAALLLEAEANALLAPWEATQRLESRLCDHVDAVHRGARIRQQRLWTARLVALQGVTYHQSHQ